MLRGGPKKKKRKRKKEVIILLLLSLNESEGVCKNRKTRALMNFSLSFFFFGHAPWYAEVPGDGTCATAVT